MIKDSKVSATDAKAVDSKDVQESKGLQMGVQRAGMATEKIKNGDKKEKGDTRVRKTCVECGVGE